MLAFFAQVASLPRAWALTALGRSNYSISRGNVI